MSFGVFTGVTNSSATPTQLSRTGDIAAAPRAVIASENKVRLVGINRLSPERSSRRIYDPERFHTEPLPDFGGAARYRTLFKGLNSPLRSRSDPEQGTGDR